MRGIAALVVVAVSLVACGRDDDGQPSAPPLPIVDGWRTYIDPETDAKFRCIVQESTATTGYGKGRGLAMWCYEPERE